MTILNSVREENVRIPKMKMSGFNTNYLHRCNPWAAAWWSAALPGFGQVYLGFHIRGFIFMSGEILINFKAKINLAIYYTFTGNFEKAHDVFVAPWGIFYVTIWLFSIYYAYKLAVEINKLCELEEIQEQRYFQRMKMSSLAMNGLSQRSPWLAVFLSIALGGMGQLYNFEFFKGMVLLVWIITINYFSHVNEMFVRGLLGQEVFTYGIDWQWLIFFPSIYAFCIWDSYACTIENNKLFIEEQRYILSKKKNFHNSKEVKEYPMIIIGNCKQSVHFELLISQLKSHGLEKYQVIFLDKLKNGQRKTGDSIRNSDGISNFNGAMCAGAVFMLFGSIWGGNLIPGGPIAIGLIGLLIGSTLGYFIDRYLVGWIRMKLKLTPIEGTNAVSGDVVIAINVESKEQKDHVLKVFVENQVYLTGTIDAQSLQSLIS